MSSTVSFVSVTLVFRHPSSQQCPLVAMLQWLFNLSGQQQVHAQLVKQRLHCQRTAHINESILRPNVMNANTMRQVQSSRRA